jgi:hypothetical protein
MIQHPRTPEFIQALSEVSLLRTDDGCLRTLDNEPTSAGKATEWGIMGLVGDDRHVY